MCIGKADKVFITTAVFLSAALFTLAVVQAQGLHSHREGTVRLPPGQRIIPESVRLVDSDRVSYLAKPASDWHMRGPDTYTLIVSDAFNDLTEVSITISETAPEDTLPRTR